MLQHADSRFKSEHAAERLSQACGVAVRLGSLFCLLSTLQEYNFESFYMTIITFMSTFAALAEDLRQWAQLPDAQGRGGAFP